MEKKGGFPLATPLKTKELGMLPRPPSSALTIVRRPIGPPAATRACLAPAKGPKADPLRLRRNHIVPVAVLQTLDRAQPEAGWSMVSLRQQEELLLPSVEYFLSNTKLWPQLCHLLLQKCGTLAAHGHGHPPPLNATLTVALYVDGYQPRGRPNVNTKISVIDIDRLLFPLSGSVPRCTDMITWLELPKVVDGEWVPK